MVPLATAARRLVVACLLAFGAVGLLAGGAAGQPAQVTGGVLVTDVDGAITPVVADHLRDAVAEAERRGSEAFVVRLDTPGGLETSMRDIVQTFFAADVPVLVHVAPSGAQAASAGAVITFAAHVAGMAPGTNIGAATPVALQGGEVGDKIVNNAAAYVEAIAAERGRDVAFAVDTVRDGRSATADEAVDLGAVDLVADDTDSLLDAVDGRTVALADGDTVTLETADVPTTPYEVSFVRRVLQVVADPNLAYLFLSIGALGIVYELANPGMGLGGVVGGILVVLGFYSLSVLPVDVVGLLMLALAIGLFVAEAFAPGVGVFAAGGAISLVVAGLFLFPRSSGLGVDLTFLLPVPILTAGVAVAIGRFVWRAQRRPAFGGTAGTMVGETATVRAVDGPAAKVFVDGALWNARSADGGLEVGQRVEVIAVEGLTLVVAPLAVGAGGSEHGRG